MGKPYDSELDQLRETYRWAVRAPTEGIVYALRGTSTLPLVAVGSGGSFTTADYAAGVHRSSTGALATALTPLEAVSSSLELRSLTVLLATAGGRNPDVLGSFRKLVEREPHRFIVVSTSDRTPLAGLAAKYSFVDYVHLDIPTGPDGFLATNSLLASIVLITRAYSDAFDLKTALPASLSGLLGVKYRKVLRPHFDRRTERLWDRETLVVLHGPATRSAAVDLESKFTEAALGNVRVADYRNFAHGRHNWLAKRRTESAVLAFVTPSDEEIASRTIELFPDDIPVLRLDVPHLGAAAGISALAQALFVVGSAGRARGIDPGRPRVLGFGRKIYHLRAFAGGGNNEQLMPSAEVSAVERKSRSAVSTLSACGQLAYWREAYAAFQGAIAKQRFSAVVFDYDGTLCDEANRETGLSTAAGLELTRLLRADAVDGVATGRGKSVKKTLRARIPRKYWGRVVVGYYNGGDVGLLKDDVHPDGSAGVVEDLAPVLAALEESNLFSRLANLEERLPQIKVEPKPGVFVDHVWELLQQLVHEQAVPGVMIVRSSHSMDVLAPGINKRSTLRRVGELLGGGDKASVLCVGDRGQWPGNDFSLLCGPHALSVDEVSLDPATCWNLAPPGHRGAQAALDYLSWLRPARGGLRLTPGRAAGRQL